jgi:hypothetical protein
MKIVIPTNYLLKALDKAGFQSLFHIEDYRRDSKVSHFVKSVQDGYYPRLHAITKEGGSETEIDIHLDLEKHKNSIQDSHLIRETIKKIREYVLV